MRQCVMSFVFLCLFACTVVLGSGGYLGLAYDKPIVAEEIDGGNGMWYVVVEAEDGDKAIITRITNAALDDGVLTIPATLDGYPVIQVGCVWEVSDIYGEEKFIYEHWTRGDETYIDGDHYGTSAVKEIHVDPNSAYLSASDGVLFNKDKTVLYWYPAGKAEASYVIPGTVTTLAPSAFEEARFSQLSFSTSLKEISEYVFDCGNLVAFTVPAGNSYFSASDGVLFNKNKTALLLYPEGKSSGRYTIPGTVVEVVGDAFRDNQALSSVTIPASVKSIGDRAFGSCYELSTVIFGSSSRLESIGESAFYECESLSEISIPASVKSIGESAFQFCYGLSTVTFGSSSRLESIGESAFYDCESLSEIVIPASVKSIGDGAFEECERLSTVTFGSSSRLESIGEWAFSWCESLSEIVIPASVKSIGESAFENCYELSTVIFGSPSRLECIGEWAFSSCECLSEIVIPASVTYIGWGAFTFCDLSSSTVDFLGDIPYDADAAFDFELYDYSDYGFFNWQADDGYYDWMENWKYLYVQIVLSYSGDEQSVWIPHTRWEYDGGVRRFLGYVTEIGEGAFYSAAISSVRVPSSVRRIGDSAFADCENLSEVTLCRGLELIGDCAFTHCPSLMDIVIPEGVIEIGAEAFEGCYSLETVSLPSSLKTLGESAFYECKSLAGITVAEGNEEYCDVDGVLFSKDMTTLIKYPAGRAGTTYSVPTGVKKIDCDAFAHSELRTVTLPEGLEVIEDFAFYGCGNLVSITIPSTVTLIEAYAFGECGLTKDTVAFLGDIPVIEEYAFDFELFTPASAFSWVETGGYEDDNGDWVECEGVRIVGYNGTETEVVIPPWIASRPVVVIGEDAFDSADISSVCVPSSVRKIDHAAFFCCENLSEVTLCRGLELIGISAFAHCPSLMEIVIPEGVIEIGAEAFEGCYSLEAVSLPSSLKTLGESAFFECESLAGITVAEGNEEYCDVDGVLFSKDMTTLIKYPAGRTGTTYSVPMGVKKIDCDAFAHSELRTVTLPEGLEVIEDFAFYRCENLVSITIPSTVTLIEEYAFGECTSLANAVFAKTSQLEEICYAAFYGCSSLSSIEIPASVVIIAEEAFYGCALSRSTVSFLGDIPMGAEYAFDFDLFTPVWDFSWETCEGYFGDNGDWVECEGVRIVGYNGTETEVVIPPWIDSHPVVVIGEDAFYDCEEVTVIELPESVRAIEYGAFSSCVALKSLALPRELEWLDEFAFSGCHALRNFSISGGNEYFCTVDGVLFSKDMTKLVKYPAGRSGTSYRVPGDVRELGAEAFHGSTLLFSVSLPDGLRLIGMDAFGWCSNLVSITIPQSVTEIDDYAFGYCAGLTAVEFEQSSKLKRIGMDAFRWCSNLASITIPQSVTEIDDSAFEYCRSLTAVEFEQSSKLKRIGMYAFLECSNLVSITIPQSVTEIDDYAFGYCAGLTAVEFEQSSKLKRIGMYAFWGCSNLASITIPQSVTEIGYGAFSECESLTSLELPDSVSYIGQHAFALSGLETLVLPEGLETLDAYILDYCSSLRQITIPAGCDTIEEGAFDDCPLLTTFAFEESPDGIDIACSLPDGSTLYVPAQYVDAWAARYPECIVIISFDVDDFVVTVDGTDRLFVNSSSYYASSITFKDGGEVYGDASLSWRIASPVSGCSVSKGGRLVVAGNVQPCSLVLYADYTLPDGQVVSGEKRIQVLAEGTSSRKLVLARGWNLVAATFVLDEESEALLLSMNPFMWSQSGRCWVVASEIQPGVPFWIYCKEGMEILTTGE